jgi:hypothetical protein
MLGIDLVVGRISEERAPLVSTDPFGGWIRGRDELRCHLTSRSEGGIVQGGEVRLNCAAGLGAVILSLPRVARDGALLLGVGRDQAGIHGKAFATNQSSCPAPLDDCFVQVAQDGTVRLTGWRHGAPWDQPVRNQPQDL